MGHAGHSRIRGDEVKLVNLQVPIWRLMSYPASGPCLPRQAGEDRDTEQHVVYANYVGPHGIFSQRLECRKSKPSSATFCSP